MAQPIEKYAGNGFRVRIPPSPPFSIQSLVWDGSRRSVICSDAEVQTVSFVADPLALEAHDHERLRGFSGVLS